MFVYYALKINKLEKRGLCMCNIYVALEWDVLVLGFCLFFCNFVILSPAVLAKVIASHSTLTVFSYFLYSRLEVLD